MAQGKRNVVSLLYEIGLNVDVLSYFQKSCSKNLIISSG